MSQVVPHTEIEDIVGVKRHPTEHWGRGVLAENRFYILHSAECFLGSEDLTECPYSRAMDLGILPIDFIALEESPVRLAIGDGQLIPHPAHGSLQVPSGL